jgi:hypothetical protein
MTINTNKLCSSMDAGEYLAVLKALYWYQDKLTNMEKVYGRDNAELDIVSKLRQRLSEQLKQEAFL